MSEKPTAIVAAKAETYKILTVGEERRKSLIAEHVGDDRMSERDLPAAQFPGSGSTTFTIPGPNGSQQVEAIEGVIIGTMERRRYYKGNYAPGVKDPPDCCSHDMETGIGHPGGDCEACPFRQWGSKDPANGDGRGAQACGHRRVFVLVRPQKLLPFIVDLPPTCLKEAQGFLYRLLDDDLRRHEVITTIGLRTNPKTEKAEIFFKHTVIDDPEIVKQLDDVRRGYGVLIDQMKDNDSIQRDVEKTEVA